MALFYPAATKSRAAFTLVELAIVLVILGLLVGGVITGKSLIRSSQLNSVITEHTRIISAVQAFDDKYSSLPGDMPNATSYWSGVTNLANGNGDGFVGIYRAVPYIQEEWNFWQELSLAGLIEGSYSGTSTTDCGQTGFGGWPWQGTGCVGGVAGVNAMQSKLNQNAGWMAIASDMGLNPVGSYITGIKGNLLTFGMSSPEMMAPALTPAEAWNIDKKLDDGLPDKGKVSAVFSGGTCMTGSPAAYNLPDTTVECSLVFVNEF